MIKYLFLAVLACMSLGATAAQKVSLPVEQINSSMNMAQKRVREASVKVTTPGGGHGSGSYLLYKDAHLVLTAQHVTDGPLGSQYYIAKDEEMKLATLIWTDPEADMALLYLPERFITIDPMKWDPQTKMAQVGTHTTYSGYPSSHKLMTFEGVVAGYADKNIVGKQIILNTYGWFGCSGSVIYTLSGKLVGVLYGVDVEYYPGVQVQENMIWVAPIQRLQIDVALKNLCDGLEFSKGRLRACR
jgi:hypothetical protein